MSFIAQTVDLSVAEKIYQNAGQHAVYAISSGSSGNSTSSLLYINLEKVDPIYLTRLTEHTHILFAVQSLANIVNLVHYLSVFPTCYTPTWLRTVSYLFIRSLILAACYVAPTTIQSCLNRFTLPACLIIVACHLLTYAKYNHKPDKTVKLGLVLQAVLHEPFYDKVPLFAPIDPVEIEWQLLNLLSSCSDDFTSLPATPTSSEIGDPAETQPVDLPNPPSSPVSPSDTYTSHLPAVLPYTTKHMLFDTDTCNCLGLIHHDPSFYLPESHPMVTDEDPDVNFVDLNANWGNAPEYESTDTCVSLPPSSILLKPIYAALLADIQVCDTEELSYLFEGLHINDVGEELAKLMDQLKLHEFDASNLFMQEL